jgi:hypothetical protein
MTTLAQEVKNLKTRVARLEAMIRHLAGDTSQAKVPAPPTPLEQPQLLTWLKDQGLIRDPTAEERRVAAAWDGLSEEDKQAHIGFMQRLVLDPLLSQIIIEQRR